MSRGHRPEAYMYVLSAGRGPKKIGVAENPAARAWQLRHLFATPPKVAFKLWRPYDTYQVEAFTFKLLAAKSLGQEMFDVSVAEAARAINEAAEAIRSGDFSAYRYDFVPRCARVASNIWRMGVMG